MIDIQGKAFANKYDEAPNQQVQIDPQLILRGRILNPERSKEMVHLEKIKRLSSEAPMARRYTGATLEPPLPVEERRKKHHT